MTDSVQVRRADAQREAASLVQVVPVGEQFGVTFRGYGPEPAVPVRLFAWQREAEAFAQTFRAALVTVLAQPGSAPRLPENRVYVQDVREDVRGIARLLLRCEQTGIGFVFPVSKAVARAVKEMLDGENLEDAT